MSTNKPLLIAGTYNGLVNKERQEHFGRVDGAGPVRLATIGTGRASKLRLELAEDRAAGRPSVVWMHMGGGGMQQTGFHPSKLVDHADTLAYTLELNRHTELGGIAVVTLMDELEQYAPWGGPVYVATYDAIASRFAVGIFTAWEKAPFVGPKKYGGPLRFAEYRPKLAVLRGYHAHGDNVDPDTEKGADVQRFMDETRDMGFAGVVVLDGGFTGSAVPGATWDTPFVGDVRDPAVSVPWLKKLLKRLEDDEVLLTVAPANDPGWSHPTWQSGRYVPGPHDPPGSPTGPAWAGCPEFCAMLEDYLALPRVLHGGDPMLKAGLAHVAKALGLVDVVAA